MARQSRQTKQKDIIQKEIAGMNAFFSAEELHAAAKRKDSNLGIATIYRLLKDMSRRSKLYTYTCDRKTVYTTEDRSHCHFICEKTGEVTHFKINSLDFLKDKIPGDIRSFQLEVRGVCRKCGK